eukprot:Nitzschia sp. Nitz4//scaffold152_size53828//5172//6317//NITZ4_006735-RA/size53828-processed-gene-0.78-mRNA-1//-1//CDS//3329537181//6295//frame0
MASTNSINNSCGKNRIWILATGLLAFAGVLALVIVLAKPDENINSIGTPEYTTAVPTSVVTDRSIPFTGGVDGYVSDPTAAGCHEFAGLDNLEVSNNTICEDTLIHYTSTLEDFELPGCTKLYQVSENAMALVAACDHVHYIINKRQGGMFVFNRTELQEEDVEGSHLRRNLGTRTWDYGYFFLANSGADTVAVLWSEDMLGQYQQHIDMFECMSGVCTFENNQIVADYNYNLRVAPGGIGVVFYKRRFCAISPDGDTQIQMFTYAERSGTRDVWFGHNTEVPSTMIDEVTSTECAAPDLSVSGCVHDSRHNDVKSCFEFPTSVCDNQTLGVCGVQVGSRDYLISCELLTAPDVGSTVYLNAALEHDTTMFEEQPVSTCYT